MGNIGGWIAGGIAAFLALLGLYLSSHAHDAVMYWTGLVFFIACILFIFGIIKQSYDRA